MPFAVRRRRRFWAVALLVWAVTAAFAAPVGAAGQDAAPMPHAADLIEFGRAYWGEPWAPDLERGGSARRPVEPDRVMDVLLLGDGYLPHERARFVAHARDWYEDLLRLTPWKQFRGAIRVRALWTPSAERATPRKGSYFALPATRADVGFMYGATTRARLFECLDRAGLNAGDPERLFRFVTVAVLVRAGGDTIASGHARALRSPDGKRRVQVAFGSHALHEFSHARAGITDEYIGYPGKRSRGARPWRVTLFGVSNLSYTRDPDRLPWRHLLPGTPTNPDPSSVIGLLWQGGEYEFRAWHSEPFCLMNGVSSNWNLAKTRRGVDLRNRGRYCFFCEELIAATLFVRTGQLGTGDGATLWKRWEEYGRGRYQTIFDVPARLRERNRHYAADPRLRAAAIVERPIKEETPKEPDPPAAPPDEEPDGPPDETKPSP